jgi:squalene-hopene/tetraprenyl-beta-curcumene cyclase
MRVLRCTGMAFVLMTGAMLAWAADKEGDSPRKAGPDAKEWDRMVEKAVAYLKSTQAEGGSWSGEKTPGITGIVITGLLETEAVGPDDPTVARGLKYLEGVVNPKEGSGGGKDPRGRLKNYVTSVSVMALATAHQEDKYKAVIGDATKFLEQLQWDEGEGIQPKGQEKSAYYGGFGYDTNNRPDLSNTQFALEALVAAGVPKDDPALKKAQIFVTRCQNLTGEGNDQPWAGTINDGSFIYTDANGGQSRAEGSSPATGWIGYGAMTYAGIKSLIYCGVSKDDPRVQKAYGWVRQHYTVDSHPGFGQRGLYYYYHTMSKCLEVLDLDEVVDNQGQKHAWRTDLIQALAKRQRPDGSWRNDQDPWMEGDANLVTGYALMALSHCQPKP